MKTAELLRKGFIVGIIGYEKSIIDFFKNVLTNMGRGSLLKHMHIIYLDPTTSAPNYIVREELRLAEEKEIDVLTITNIERVFDIFGYENIKRYSIYAIQNLRNLRITTVRYYRYTEKHPEPLVYLDWSDIVIELKLDHEGRTLIKITSPLLFKTPTIINDDELTECISLLFKSR